MSGQKRKSYTADFKLKAIERAEHMSNRKAALELGIGESSIRDWRKDKDALMKINPRKRARRGPRAKLPTLEKDLKEWILSQREQKHCVSTQPIETQAKQLATQRGMFDFKAGFTWISKFMKRNSLSVRARTTVGQQLPENWEERMANFREFVGKAIEESGLTPGDVINMDEVPMSFDIPATRTVAEAGTKSIAIKTTGHERTCLTVVLACTASGVKLKPMLIFKRVTMPREKLPNSVVVHCNKKGWMDTDVMKLWVDKCFRCRPGGFFKKQSLLIFDAMAAHKEKTVQTYIKQCWGTYSSNTWWPYMQAAAARYSGQPPLQVFHPPRVGSLDAVGRSSIHTIRASEAGLIR